MNILIICQNITILSEDCYLVHNVIAVVLYSRIKLQNNLIYSRDYLPIVR